MTTWKLTINVKLWNVEKFVADYEELSARKRVIPFSKGRAHMVVTPQPGDKVYVVCGGKRIMKGTVRTGFVNGTAHQQDPYNLGSVRRHAEPTEYARVAIEKVYTLLIRMRGNQRTWTRIH